MQEGGIVEFELEVVGFEKQPSGTTWGQARK
jgi:hypothetical protein